MCWGGGKSKRNLLVSPQLLPHRHSHGCNAPSPASRAGKSRQILREKLLFPWKSPRKAPESPWSTQSGEFRNPRWYLQLQAKVLHSGIRLWGFSGISSVPRCPIWIWGHSQMPHLDLGSFPDAPPGFGVIPRYPTPIWGLGHHIHQDVASALFLPKPLLLQFSVLKTTTGVIQPPPECLLPGKNGLDSNLSSSPPQITPDKLPFVGAAAPSHLSPLRGSSLPIYFPLTVPGIFRTPCNYGHGLVYPCQRRLSA